MNEEYANRYQTLGIRPGARWDELRRTYKNLVKVWHPDRFQQDPRKKKLAEEKTKEITQAYKELAQYYKQFGVLPLAAETAQIETAGVVMEPAAAQSAPDIPPVADVPEAEPAINDSPEVKRKRRRLQVGLRIAAAATLASVAYFAWRLIPGGRFENSDADNGGRTAYSADAGGNGDANPDASPPVEKRFTVGASLGEVYSIQGIPTKTENDTWYYGKSKVYFVKGKVLKWEESSDNPLRVQLLPDAGRLPVYFTKGSTKAEVLAVQGPPERDSGSVWDYGVSRVYFDKDRVKGWHESPLNPLKVRH